MTSILYYIHDPMCSWCYGFTPTWNRIQENLPSTIKVEYVVGGLAPDSSLPMPQETQQIVKGAWQTIQDMLGTEFNFKFWDKNTPRRSTYPACRAVLAARIQNFEKEMIIAIQQGYYLRALNPSDDNILIQLATELKNEMVEQKINVDQFISDLNSKEIAQELTSQISLSRKLTQRGFPSLVLEHNGSIHFLEHDYQDQNVTLNKINAVLD